MKSQSRKKANLPFLILAKMLKKSAAETFFSESPETVLYLIKAKSATTL